VTVPAVPPADDKDWTFVVEQPCAECGFDPAGVDVRDGFDARVRGAGSALAAAATAVGGTERPAPAVWSALEYAAHVRDACEVFGARVDAMRDEDGVRFANWDQDATALERRYAESDPTLVAEQVRAGCAAMADRFAAVTQQQWQHRGFRSNGSAFTVATIAVYFLHDLEHHVHDVSA
jgi:hypothetical protein